jgi:hypothetical protein
VASPYIMLVLAVLSRLCVGGCSDRRSGLLDAAATSAALPLATAPSPSPQIATSRDGYAYGLKWDGFRAGPSVVSSITQQPKH